VNILGGDTTATTSLLVINVTVTGEVEGERIVYRSGAKPGDRVYVSGAVGDAAGGLEALRRGVETGAHVRELIRRHHEPLPQLDHGARIASTRKAHAMIDVSDGLAADLAHLCDESGVGAELVAAQIPVSPELRRFCGEQGLDPLHLALGGGEDFVLLVTGPADLAGAAAAAGTALVEIGRILSGGHRTMIDAEGRVAPLARLGWDHLRQPAR
jgi:thiamine-monophosphate kinase